jgi:hypothetical protein
MTEDEKAAVLCSSYSCVVSNISCKWKYAGSQEFSLVAYIDAIF